jgi:alanyl-tRNA synthetase
LTERLFRDDPYLLEFEATVVAAREHEGRPAVVLDRTAFYAESGGQPWDTGRLDDVAVVAVIDAGQDVLHVLDRPLAKGARVRGRVDADRRRDHRQQHHGQHLLSRAFVEVANARTVSFHLGADVSSIDLDREVGDAETRAAEARANEVVWEARPVTVRTMSPADARAAGIEPPADAGDAIRIVEAEGFDRQPCGGTHPRSTAEVGVVIVLGRERYKGGSRLRFVCGRRALDTSRERNAVLDALSRTLSAPIPALPEMAAHALERLAESDKTTRELLDRALEGEARRLVAETAPARAGFPPTIVAVYEGWPVADLRTLALHLVRLSPCVALLGSRSDKAHVVFAQAEGLGHDIPALLRKALVLLEGRGGGKGNVAQGAGDRAERLPEALHRAAAALLANG